TESRCRIRPYDFLLEAGAYVLESRLDFREIAFRILADALLVEGQRGIDLDPRPDRVDDDHDGDCDEQDDQDGSHGSSPFSAGYHVSRTTGRIACFDGSPEQ